MSAYLFAAPAQQILTKQLLHPGSQSPASVPTALYIYLFPAELESSEFTQPVFCGSEFAALADHTPFQLYNQ